MPGMGQFRSQRRSLFALQRVWENSEASFIKGARVKINSHAGWNLLVLDTSVTDNSVDVLGKIVSHQIVRLTNKS
jgi:hypothetical protein